MVVWLRQDQQGVAIPDGVVRSADWLHVGSLDDSYRALARMRAVVLEEAQAQAQAIIEAAYAQAEQIRADAEEVARKLHDEAYASGRQAGIDEWTRHLLQSSLQTHQQLKQQRERMARMVLAAVEKIAPLQDSQGVYRQVLRMLSKSMQAVRYVNVRVCPQELAHAETALRELARGSAIGKLIEVSADERLAVGACLVESDQGIIDLSLGSQLKALRDAITGVVRGDVPAAAATAGDGG
jgi:type III secretion protein L